MIPPDTISHANTAVRPLPLSVPRSEFQNSVHTKGSAFPRLKDDRFTQSTGSRILNHPINLPKRNHSYRHRSPKGLSRTPANSGLTIAAYPASCISSPNITHYTVRTYRHIPPATMTSPLPLQPLTTYTEDPHSGPDSNPLSTLNLSILQSLSDKKVKGGWQLLT